MADRQDSDREVLTSLPRSRPVRRSAKRGERSAAAKGAATATAARRKPAAKPRAAKAPAGAAKGKPPKSAAGKTAADATAATTPARAPKAGHQQRTPPSRVAPRRKVPPAGYAAPTSRAGETPASGAADLIGTTLQAAAELTQIGLAVGRQTLQSMLDRLPRP